MNVLFNNSFEAVTKLNSISFGDISAEYTSVPFNVELLFTIVRL